MAMGRVARPPLLRTERSNSAMAGIFSGRWFGLVTDVCEKGRSKKVCERLSADEEEDRGDMPDVVCGGSENDHDPGASKNNPTMMDLREKLYQQHEIDLKIYRESHENYYNRLLHHVFIPLETVGFFALLMLVLVSTTGVIMVRPKKCRDSIIVIGRILVPTACWTLGLLSLILSPDLVGVLALLFHGIAIPWLLPRGRLLEEVEYRRYHNSMMIAWTMLTIVSWGIQICIGHWVLEQNQPTLRQGTASALSMLTSIVISWKS
jgi:Protein of unknown function (DUF962)